MARSFVCSKVCIKKSMYVSPDSLIRDVRSVRSNVFDGSETEINLCVTFSLQRHKRMDALWLVVRFEIFFLRAGLGHGKCIIRKKWLWLSYLVHSLDGQRKRITRSRLTFLQTRNLAEENISPLNYLYRSNTIPQSRLAMIHIHVRILALLYTYSQDNAYTLFEHDTKVSGWNGSGGCEREQRFYKNSVTLLFDGPSLRRAIDYGISAMYIWYIRIKDRFKPNWLPAITISSYSRWKVSAKYLFAKTAEYRNLKLSSVQFVQVKKEKKVTQPEMDNRRFSLIRSVSVQFFRTIWIIDESFDNINTQDNILMRQFYYHLTLDFKSIEISL